VIVVGEGKTIRDTKVDVSVKVICWYVGGL